MKIPRLDMAFCGCTLETGTKIIAWIGMVSHVLAFMILGIIAIMGTAVLYGVSHQENQQEDENSKAFIIVGAVGVVIFIVLVMVVISFVATLYLLLGAYKKRPGYMVFWLVLSVLGLIVSLGSITIKGFVFFAINLYFTWVVYSHYKQLCDNENSVMQPTPVQVKLQGDVPYAVTVNAPPAYSFNQGGY